jgi:hypothetical protein
MSQNPWNSNAFKIQIVCLILAPSFVAASIYLTIKYLVLYFGAEYSILKARWYPWLFIGCDILSIVMQAIGGGVSAAATGGNNDNASLLSTGNNLMIAGIAFQVATMGLAGILFLTFAIRYRKGNRGRGRSNEGSPEPKFATSREDKEHKRTIFLYCAVVALAYLTVLIRCIYRSVTILPDILDANCSPKSSRNGRRMGKPTHARRDRILDTRWRVSTVIYPYET